MTSGQEINQIGLAPATTSYTDRGQERVIYFLDWTIDGQPLRTLLGARPPQEMTPLSEEGFWPRVAADHLRALLGESAADFADGRVAVLVCPIDADLGCSSISMRLGLDEDHVHWREFGRQVDYEPFDPGQAFDVEFCFDRRAYEAFLRATLTRFPD